MTVLFPMTTLSSCILLLYPVKISSGNKTINVVYSQKFCSRQREMSSNYGFSKQPPPPPPPPPPLHTHTHTLLTQSQAMTGDTLHQELGKAMSLSTSIF